MNKLQILIENIRMVISASDIIPPDQIQIYARDYAEACAELNRRMQQCLPQIRSGNFAEAVRLAEITPNLPELYSLLDFPERDHWRDIVSTLGYDEPPSLSEDLSKELNEAYIKFSPLEPLLRWHRLHALNDSPLRDRLMILRAITQADTENLFWSEDREKFEKARIEELEKEVHDTVASKNEARARTLYDELDPSLWSVAPPPALKRQLCSIVLQKYFDELQRSYGAFEYEPALEASEKIQNLLQAENLQLSQKMANAMRPVLNWIRETQEQQQRRTEFLRTTNDLHEALEDDRSSGSLERLYYALNNAASEAGEDIPEAMEELYQSRIYSHEAKRSRKTKLAVISVICVSLLIGGFLAWGMKERMFRQKVAQTQALLQQIESENRFEDISGTIERIEKESPEIAKLPQIVGLIEKLRGLERNDQERAADFQRNWNQANTALDVPIRPSFEDLQKIGIPITQMEKLARTPAEKNQFTELKRKHEMLLAERKREMDTNFSEKLASLTNEFRTFSNQEEPADPEQVVSQLQGLAQQAEQLAGQGDVSAALVNNCKNLAMEITARKDKIQLEMKQSQAFARLDSGIGNWSGFQKALQQFSNENTGHFAVADILEVLDELDVIKEAGQPLSELVRDYSQRTSNLKRLTQDSGSLWERLDDMQSHWTPNELERLFTPYQSLEILSKRSSSSRDRFMATEKILKSCTQREVWPWVNGQQWYYLIEKPTKGGTYRYITSFATEDKTVRMSIEEFKKFTPLPGQHQFAIFAMKRIDAAGENAVETACSLMSPLLKAEGIDPILKCVLLDALMTDMSKTEPLFAIRFKNVLDMIKKSGVDLGANWMDVQAKNTPSQRSSAKAVLERLPDLKNLAKSLQDDMTQFQTKVQSEKPRFEWVGFLVKRNNEWNCVTRPGFSFGNSGDLLVLRTTPEKTVQSHVIGNVSQGDKVSIRQGSTASLQCLPVFFKK